MPKKPCVRTFMDSQHVKVSEGLHKSVRQYFCHIFWSLWREITSQNSVSVEGNQLEKVYLLVSKILRLFVNALIETKRRGYGYETGFNS